MATTPGAASRIIAGSGPAMEVRLIRHGIVDSTNERAFAAAAAGEGRHGDLHVAEGQSAGRGRRGRRWESAAGEGIYASLLLLPPAPLHRPVVLTMGAGLGVVETVRELGAVEAVLDWPNDVHVRGAKLAGILVEARGRPAERAVVAVGIGINVRQHGFPPALEAERPVTSFARLGLAVAVDGALAVLCRRLPLRIEEALTAGEGVAADYLSATGLAGRCVRARRGSEEIRGRLEGLSLAAGLSLRQPNGRRRSLPLEHVIALDLDAAGPPDPQ
ncbi:MAG: biotin--[acetyl-CoA-carboxylase] ligase [Planctomycetota bacterium]